MSRYETRKGWTLVDQETGEDINVGDYRTLSDGEEVRVAYLQPPHKASSSGFVHWSSLDGSGHSGRYYATVFNAKFVYTEPQSIMSAPLDQY